MAHRTTLEEEHPAKAPRAAKTPGALGTARVAGNEDRERVFDAFRRWGTWKRRSTHSVFWSLRSAQNSMGWPAKRLKRRGASIAVRWARILCTCRIRKGGAGSPSGWNRLR